MTAAPIWSLLRRSMTRAGAQATIAVLGLLAGRVCLLAGAAAAGDRAGDAGGRRRNGPRRLRSGHHRAACDGRRGELLAGAIVALMVTGGAALALAPCGAWVAFATALTWTIAARN